MPSDGGFFSRWSQRKTQATQNEAQEAVQPLQVATPDLQAVQQAEVHTPASLETQSSLVPTADPDTPNAPTLEDAAQLTPESDYSRFVARDVRPEVRHLALKKLFSDPHFNVMDGLDIYIDDYSIADPLPPSMLAKMAHTAYLGMPQEAPSARPETDSNRIDHQQKPGAAGDVQEPLSTDSAVDNVSTAVPHTAFPSDAVAMKERDEESDMRLQPFDASGSSESGAGTGGNTRN